MLFYYTLNTKSVLPPQTSTPIYHTPDASSIVQKVALGVSSLQPLQYSNLHKK